MHVDNWPSKWIVTPVESLDLTQINQIIETTYPIREVSFWIDVDSRDYHHLSQNETLTGAGSVMTRVR
jgi:hypothetical protein